MISFRSTAWLSALRTRGSSNGFLAMFERDEEGARAVDRHDLRALARLDLPDRGGRQFVDDVDLAGQQRGDARGILRE